MQKRNIHIATTILGLLLAIAVICANVLLPQTNTAAKAKAKTEQQTPDQQYSFVSATTIAPPSSFATIKCSLFAHCIFEIGQEPEHQEQYAVAGFVRPQKLFRTLFRVIISPNAP